jgi:dihydropyrimidine dehydrogenase (NAD+) subunit PreA
MHHGYRIVEDMIEGLEGYLASKKMRAVNELVAHAVPASSSGAISTSTTTCGEDRRREVHRLPAVSRRVLTTARTSASTSPASNTRTPDTSRRWRSRADESARGVARPPYRVPWSTRTECVGCNLCALVCPVENCITMVEQRRAPEPTPGTKRMAEGRDKVPGGLADLH